MVFNASFPEINYAMQVASEQDIKLYIIFWLLVVSLTFLYIDKKKLVGDKRISIILLKTFMRVFYWAMLLFSPYLIYFYSYTETLNELTYFLMGIYISAMTGGILILAFYLFERLFKDFLGWEITLDGFKINMNKINEGKENGK